MSKQRTVGATEFKTKCLALLDEVDQGGGTIVVTKRGRPVAVIAPAPKVAWKSPKGSWVGKMKILGDIVNTDSSELWEAASKIKPQF